MPTNEYERELETKARRIEKGRNALVDLGIPLEDANIGYETLGYHLEIGEKCVQGLGKTFSWPNPYKERTSEYKLYEKIVAPKREAAMQRLTSTS